MKIVCCANFITCFREYYVGKHSPEHFVSRHMGIVEYILTSFYLIIALVFPNLGHSQQAMLAFNW